MDPGYLENLSGLLVAFFATRCATGCAIGQVLCRFRYASEPVLPLVAHLSNSPNLFSPLTFHFGAVRRSRCRTITISSCGSSSPRS
jgi:hypothetical protein